MKLKLTTTATPEKIREAMHDILGHNAHRILIEPAPPPPAPTITLRKPLTNHWLDRSWRYQPSTSHNDASEFRKRMEMRRMEVQKQEQSTTTDVPTTEKQ